MTAEEREKLITDNMNVVRWTVFYDFTVNRYTPLLEYDDMRQIGYMALCEAADAYDGSVKFSTFAKKVVFNRLIDYCRKMKRIQDKIYSLQNEIPDSDEMIYEAVVPDKDPLETAIDEQEAVDLLHSAKSKYSGITLKGIEAIELKLKGYTGVEIAALYGIKPNLLAAWISRAKQKLKSDADFIAAFTTGC